MPTPNYTVGGNVNPSRFVKRTTDANNEVVEADANEAVVGVSGEAGRSAPIPEVTTNYAGIDGDKSMKVYGDGDTCMLEYGDTVVAGDYLKSDADGKGVPIATTGATAQHIGAQALSAGAAGDKRLVLVHIQTKVYPALS